MGRKKKGKKSEKEGEEKRKNEKRKKSSEGSLLKSFMRQNRYIEEESKRSVTSYNRHFQKSVCYERKQTGYTSRRRRNIKSKFEIF